MHGLACFDECTRKINQEWLAVQPTATLALNAEVQQTPREDRGSYSIAQLIFIISKARHNTTEKDMRKKN